jgi:protein-S-isoprenylcysteine O-methyltransferase Ste14
MTTSASTPRLRLTQLYYVLLLLASFSFVGASGDRWGASTASLISFVLVTLACLGRLWCSVYIAGRKDSVLVMDGPYARCRHPLYAWSLVAGLGLGLATRSWALTAVTIVVLTLLFAAAIRREDRYLQEKFGAAFTHYAQHTPTLWPRLRQLERTTPQSVEVQPAVYRKAFLDAGSIWLLWSLIETTQALHRAGALPNFGSLL